MNTDLLNATKKLKRRYSRSTIINYRMHDEFIHLTNFLACNNIDKNLNQILYDETIEEKEKRLIELFPTIKKNTDGEFEETLLSIEKNIVNFSTISVNEYEWLNKIINIAENIPVCITISSAKKEIFGFPLIYVNKQFEKTTGYNRNEIIGKNCKFLQPKVPIREEETQHKIIKNCLGMGIPACVIITNVKKSSIPFHNLISLKPVIDKDGNYLYSIGIQSEITTEPLNKIDTRNVVDLMNILSKIEINIIN